MSKSIRIPSSAFTFVPSGSTADMNIEQLEPRLRAELDATYSRRLAEETDRCRSEGRRRSEQLLQQCTAQFGEFIKALRHEIQDQVVDLSIRLAEVIVRHRLPDEEMLRNLVTQTLAPVSDLQGARVRISTADRELIGDRMLHGDDYGLRHAVEFVDDPELSSGDVVVESRNGIFDARLKERINLLKETLHERCGRKDESAPAV